MKKRPEDIRAGDTVIAHRGIYSGAQCEVKAIEPTRYGNFNLKVVPTIPVAGNFTVDGDTETVEVIDAERRSTSATGALMIVRERLRQVNEEGWTPTHDDSHVHAELVDAAVTYAYAYTAKSPARIPVGVRRWPWAQRWWKPADRVRNLVKAGALIAAEIDRLLRARDGSD